MSINKRKVIIISSIIFLCTFLVFSYTHFLAKNKIELDEHSDLLSIWVEDSSGNFQVANSFPGAGYILDLNQSKCENGGTLSGDGTGVTLTANKSDKCYLYFIRPWLNTNTTRTLTCNNSAKTFDYKINGASFDVSTDADLTCTATKTANATTQTFAQYIASLAGTTQGTGQVVNENGYRYEGKDPNNYIWFNNEMWRIIGVFGSSRHGVTNDPRTINSVSDTYLVKIIRAESIGGYAWNGVTGVASNLNDWPNSTLYRMLNGCYYNALTGTDTTTISGSNAACSNYCKGGYDTNKIQPTSNCDFSVIGIQDDGEDFSYRDLIQSATWYLGGSGKTDYTTYYPDNIYSYETDQNAIYTGRSTDTTGYIGLMYLSDYGYSVLNSSCTRGSYTMDTNNASSYSATVCAGNSWLYGQGYEWTISPFSNNSTSAWIVDYTGQVSNHYANVGYSVRPVLYLKSSTYKFAGTGSKSNPYVIGLG